MPVTLKIDDRDRRDTEAMAADLSDYAAGERGEGTKAMLVWLIVIALLSGLPLLNANTVGIGIGVFVWWLVTCIGYFWLAPRMVLRRLRLHAPEYSITKTKYPRLKTMLAKGSALLDVEEPEGYLTPEGPPLIRIMGGRPPFVVVTQAALDTLTPPEMDCMLLRALMHARQGHVRRLMLERFLADTPGIMRPLVWPIALYAFLLRFWWEDPAHETADRLTLLLTRNPRLLTSAILKLNAANDPRMLEREISAEDVDNYIKQQGTIGTKGQEISTQYKIGQAVHENVFLEERLQNINSWVRSPDFKAALQKLDEAKATKTEK